MGGMDPLIRSMTTTVAQDVRELVHATQFEPFVLLEKNPPNWRWHLPLGFVTLAATDAEASTLTYAIVSAAGGLHARVQERKHGARRQTSMHKQKVRLGPVALP